MYENDGTPFVGDWPIHAVGDSVESIHSVEAADLDSDGDVDLVVGSGGAGMTAQILAGQNDGTPFDGAWPWHPVGLVSSSAICHAEVALADVDGNGTIDVASATSAYAGIGSVIIWYNAAPWSGPWAQSVVFGGTSLGSIATGRFNGDERPDLAVSVSEGSLLLLSQHRRLAGSRLGLQQPGIGRAGHGVRHRGGRLRRGRVRRLRHVHRLPALDHAVGLGEPAVALQLARSGVRRHACDGGGDGRSRRQRLPRRVQRQPRQRTGAARASGVAWTACRSPRPRSRTSRPRCAPWRSPTSTATATSTRVSGSDLSLEGEVLAWQNLHTVDTATRGAGRTTTGAGRTPASTSTCRPTTSARGCTTSSTRSACAASGRSRRPACSGSASVAGGAASTRCTTARWTMPATSNGPTTCWSASTASRRARPTTPTTCGTARTSP